MVVSTADGDHTGKVKTLRGHKQPGSFGPEKGYKTYGA